MRLGNLIRRRDTIIQRADAARDAKTYGKAALLYQRALPSAHNPGEIHILCGHMFKEAGDFARAEYHYDRASELDPSNADLAVNRGHFYKLTGRLEDAEREYRKAVELAPNWPEAAIHLAELHKAGRTTEPNQSPRASISDAEGYNETAWLHQVIIERDTLLADHLRAEIHTSSQEARKTYPFANYKLWYKDELRSLISNEFGQKVVLAFDSLKNDLDKSNLARFCLLHVYGGLYFDLAIRLMNVWKVPEDCGIASFTPSTTAASWTAMETDLLWSRPKRPEWSIAIEGMVENCRRGYSDPNGQFPNPRLGVGRAFASVMMSKGQTPEADDQWVGEVRSITQGAYQTRAYVSPDRVLVGLRAKAQIGEPDHSK